MLCRLLLAYTRPWHALAPVKTTVENLLMDTSDLLNAITEQRNAVANQAA